jgi:transcriptional regulator with XRE-family HTH domain
VFDIHILSENIKKYRKLKGLTQNELAEKLVISPQSVSKWECGLSVPDISNLCKISNLLEISLDLLLGNTEASEKAMIAVDGGGNQTEFLLFNESGKLLSRIVLPGCNPNYVSVNTCCAILKHGIDRLMGSTNKISGIFIGASGFDCGNNSKIVQADLSLNYKKV